MPFVKFDLIRGRSPEEITTLLDICHHVFLETLDIPEGDRYQVVTQHEPYEMQMADTGLGFERTQAVVLLSITSRSRTRVQKETLYRRLQEELTSQIGLRPEDLMINFTINEDEDWSFSHGRAQFLTGELA